MPIPSFRRAGLVLAALAVQGCSATPTMEGEDPRSSPSQQTAARPSDEVVLPVGATAVYAAQATAVTYVRLVGDSRCPLEALCVWEGDAEVLLKVVQGRAAAVEVSLHTRAGSGLRRWEAGAWALELVRVDPYPSLSVSPDPARTRVALRLVAREG